MSKCILEISNGESKKTLQWFSYGIEYGDEWVDNLSDLTELIMDIVRSKPEY